MFTVAVFGGDHSALVVLIGFVGCICLVGVVWVFCLECMMVAWSFL